MTLDFLTLDGLRAMSPDAAAALLAYREAEGLGALDADVLVAWRQLAPENAEAWANVKAAWADFDESEGDEILAALRADARAAGPERRRWRPLVAGIAASMLLVLGGLAFVSGSGAPGEAGSPTMAARPELASPGLIYANALDHPQAFRLSDGSSMTLDVGSRAHVAQTENRRDVRLMHGRAFFDVEPDLTRPFAVRAAGEEVVALGTQFEVRLHPGTTSVVLVEGRVAVRSARSAAPTVLLPGQKLVVRDGASVVSAADVSEATEWWHRYVVFEDASLADAAAQLSRIGPDRIVVRDPVVAALRITGRFRAGDPQRFGRSLSVLHPVHLVQRGPSEWEIVANP